MIHRGPFQPLPFCDSVKCIIPVIQLPEQVSSFSKFAPTFRLLNFMLVNKHHDNVKKL